jgi:hypothetical protein
MFSVTFKPCILSVIMLNAVMLNVVMLSVVAPYVTDSDKQGTYCSHKSFILQAPESECSRTDKVKS